MLQHRACSLTSSKPSTSACFIRPSPRAVQVSLGNLTPKIVIVQKNCWQIRCSVPGGGDETPSTSSTGLDTPAPAQTPVPLNPTWVDAARSALKTIVDNRRVVAVAVAVADVVFLWLAVKGYKIWEAGEH